MNLLSSLHLDQMLRKWLRYLAVLVFLVELCNLCVPWLFGRVIDSLASNDPFGNLFFCLLVLAVVGLVLDQLALSLSAVMARHWEANLRQLSLDSWCLQQPDSAERWPQGEAGMKFMRDIPILGNALQSVFPQLLRTMTLLFLALSFAFFQCRQVFHILLCAFPLLLVINFYFRRQLNHIAHKMRSTQDMLCSRVFEFLNSYPELKALEADSHYRERVASGLGEITNVEYNSAKLQIAFQRSFKLLLLSCEYIVLGTVCFLASHGHILIGQIVFFQIMIMRVLNGGVGILQLLPQLIAIREARDSLNALIEQGQKTSASDGAKLDGDLESIELANVSFAYADSQRKVFENYSLHVSRGEVISLEGVNGIGKTTMWKILAGWQTPTGGVVYVNGKPLSEHLGDFRRRVAFVAQNTLLFYGSLLENITLGASDIRAEDLDAALRLSGFDKVVARFPEGLGKHVEAGAGMSGGECQRLSLARALYRKPELLVLDEVTNHMDTSGKEIVKSLIQSMRGRAMLLVITHDAEIRALCDREVTLQ